MCLADPPTCLTQKKRFVEPGYIPSTLGAADHTKDETTCFLHACHFSQNSFGPVLLKDCNVCLQVIKTLDPKQQPVTPDIQALKNQLTEKERKIQHLEVSHNRSKTRRSSSRHQPHFDASSCFWHSMTTRSPGRGTNRRRSSSSPLGTTW